LEGDWRECEVEDKMEEKLGLVGVRAYRDRGVDSPVTIGEYQAAYKKGYGCEDHVFLLNSILQHGLL
jgi:hypothetical protein